MGAIDDFAKEKLVVGLLLGPGAPEGDCLRALEGVFGPVDYTSTRINFNFTSYYDAELGTPITRIFVSFRDPVSPDTLADVKITTNALEREFALAGRRRINLDPGTLALSRFVLASTKPSSHRVPLTKGIHAEVELMFEHGAFRPVEWTYADYRSPDYLTVLGEIREIYRLQMKSAG